MSLVSIFLSALLHGVLLFSAPATGRVVATWDAAHLVVDVAAGEQAQAPRVLGTVPPPSQAVIRAAVSVSLSVVDRSATAGVFTETTSTSTPRHAPWTLAARLALDRAIAARGSVSYVVAARGRLRPFHSTAPPAPR